MLVKIVIFSVFKGCIAPERWSKYKTSEWRRPFPNNVYNLQLLEVFEDVADVNGIQYYML